MPYMTMSNDYVESVWCRSSSCGTKNLIYQGFKVLPYCPRCGTPLSSHRGRSRYEDITDPSIFVPFRSECRQARLPPGTCRCCLDDDPVDPAGKRGPRHQSEDDLRGRSIPETRCSSWRIPGRKDVWQQSSRRGRRVRCGEPGRTGIRTPVPPRGAGQEGSLRRDRRLRHREEGPASSNASSFGADDMEMARQNDLPVLHTVNEEGRYRQVSR